ncbi:phage portal protein [Vibrio sp. JC009]|uniref:phage portal protein n=1 Tax=Vibrio sp. JC009 TaxID=2912314 RepID=UPI0023AF0586|nr:phage portal protein [Vibrio sp. JC009]WED23512.1 phage portal protein [Vibrio sp. JC009]
MIEIEFSDPTSVMNSDILSYMEVALIDGLYEPPIPFDTLAKALRANPMHSSAIEFKRNTLAYSVSLAPVLSKGELKRFIQDFLTFGNGYFQIVRNLFGAVVQIKHIPALYMRRREDLGYTYKPKAYDDDGRIDYRDGQIFHLAEYDVAQEIYGLPQHISGLTSIWLSDDATLFRRQYYRNGSHAGYLLYLNEPTMTEKQEQAIRDKLTAKEGMAFKNLFVNGKGKDSKAPELKPIGQVEAKDAFKDIKNSTTNDVLSVHRVPLELMSIQREGFSTSNDLNKVDRIFHKNELLPLVDSMMELNEFVGMEVIKVNEYEALETMVTQ